MELLHLNQSFTRWISAQRLLKDHPLGLIDVGCSGGISESWRAFEPDFAAAAFDPVVPEVERLQRQETNPMVKFVAGFAGLPDSHPFVQKRGTAPVVHRNPWNRFSAQWALELEIQAKEKAGGDPGSAAQLADPSPIGVDDYVAASFPLPVDFLKVDVDGHDMDVLLSAEKTVRDHPVLGIGVEVNYCGSDSDTDHTFHNMDRLLRSWGFDLFGLTVRTYSGRHLPFPFAIPIPAQSTGGRPMQGDAVYFRDVCADEPLIAVDSIPSHGLIKLACMFESFGVPDAAAEVLVKHRSRLEPLFDVAKALDLLSESIPEAKGDYAAYVERFRRECGIYVQTDSAPPSATAAEAEALAAERERLAEEAQRLAERNDALNEERRRLKQEIAAAKSKVKSLREERDELRRSRFYRWGRRVARLFGGD